MCCSPAARWRRTINSASSSGNRRAAAGWALAVSPKGDRLAVGGYPGLFVLDAAGGKVLGGSKAGPLQPRQSYGASRIICAAWNSAGTLVAGGWMNNVHRLGRWKTHVKPDLPKLEPIVLDAEGNALPGPQGIIGSVYGMAFVPNYRHVAPRRRPVDRGGCPDRRRALAQRHQRRDGLRLLRRRHPRRGGRLGQKCREVQPGGWQAHARPPPSTPTWAASRCCPAAIWSPPSGAAPARCSCSATASSRPEPFFQSSYGFQHVLWSPADNALVAAEEGGKLWLLNPEGKALALLEDDAGATAYRMSLQGNTLLLGRMNHAVQRIGITAMAK